MVVLTLWDESSDALSSLDESPPVNQQFCNVQLSSDEAIVCRVPVSLFFNVDENGGLPSLQKLRALIRRIVFQQQQHSDSHDCCFSYVPGERSSSAAIIISDDKDLQVALESVAEPLKLWLLILPACSQQQPPTAVRTTPAECWWFCFILLPIILSGMLVRQMTPNSPSLAVGNEHACVLFSDGKLKCFGKNDFGQLNRGESLNDMGSNLPFVELGKGRGVVQVACGGKHNCAILDNGGIKCWGYNAYGQLGYDSTDKRHRGDSPNEMGDKLPFVDLGTDQKPKMIVAGSLHSCVLFVHGKIKCWGYNEFNQLGLSTDAGNRGGPDTHPFVDLGNDKATEVTAGGYHTCAMLDSGEVKCWGKNHFGQLGHGSTETCCGSSHIPTVALGSGTRAVGIAAGLAHTCALFDDGFVKCWGWNYYGQLGYGHKEHVGLKASQMGDELDYLDLGHDFRAASLSAGERHTCAISTQGRVKCWGSEFQLGSGQHQNRGDDKGEMGDRLDHVDFGTEQPAVLVGAGTLHTCALLQDGAIHCWGTGGQGRLGNGPTYMEASPKPVILG